MEEYSQIRVPFTEEDDESALDKLRQVALHWDSRAFVNSVTTKGTTVYSVQCTVYCVLCTVYRVL
jgi:hypothetical protein